MLLRVLFAASLVLVPLASAEPGPFFDEEEGINLIVTCFYPNDVKKLLEDTSVKIVMSTPAFAMSTPALPEADTQAVHVIVIPPDPPVKIPDGCNPPPSPCTWLGPYMPQMPQLPGIELPGCEQIWDLVTNP